VNKQWELANDRMLASMERKGASRYGGFELVVKRLSPTRALCISISDIGKMSRLQFGKSLIPTALV
jgi:hypothetical protein